MRRKTGRYSMSFTRTLIRRCTMRRKKGKMGLRFLVINKGVRNADECYDMFRAAHLSYFQIRFNYYTYFVSPFLERFLHIF